VAWFLIEYSVRCVLVRPVRFSSMYLYSLLMPADPLLYSDHWDLSVALGSVAFGVWTRHSPRKAANFASRDIASRRD
jgi:hypothetical protein